MDLSAGVLLPDVAMELNFKDFTTLADFSPSITLSV